jgi:nitrogen fixation NifU-like protein
LCGDAYTVYICLDGERLTSVSFEGAGCAISKASASVMTTLVEGRTLSEIAAIHDRFKNLLSGSEVDLNESELGEAERNETESQQGERESNVPVADSKLQDLNLFEGLRETKSRVKCALLCWSALYGAIAQESSSTTESS